MILEYGNGGLKGKGRCGGAWVTWNVCKFFWSKRTYVKTLDNSNFCKMEHFLFAIDLSGSVVATVFTMADNC